MSLYLIDTHILLWWLSDDKKLTKKIKAILSNPDNEIIVSAVTLWEIAIKKSLNKLKTPDFLKEVLHENSFKILPMTGDHALYVEHLPHIHSDPFDRLLIAQSIVEKVPLITKDPMIHKYKVSCIY